MARLMREIDSTSSDSFLKTENYEIVTNDPVTFKFHQGSIIGSFDDDTGK